MSLPFLPCIPIKVMKPPIGARWIHEIKHDGFRLMARREGGRVILRTRDDLDRAERYLASCQFHCA